MSDDQGRTAAPGPDPDDPDAAGPADERSGDEPRTGDPDSPGLGAVDDAGPGDDDDLPEPNEPA